MTRDEQILKAAREYNRGITLSSPSNVIHFENGAKWADKHPINVWHYANKEPEKHSPILIEVINTLTSQNEIRYYIEYVEEWVIGLMKTEGFKCRWAYIKDLLPKGGEE